MPGWRFRFDLRPKISLSMELSASSRTAIPVFFLKSGNLQMQTFGFELDDPAKWPPIKEFHSQPLDRSKGEAPEEFSQAAS